MMVMIFRPFPKRYSWWVVSFWGPGCSPATSESGTVSTSSARFLFPLAWTESVLSLYCFRHGGELCSVYAWSLCSLCARHFVLG